VTGCKEVSRIHRKMDAKKNVSSLCPPVFGDAGFLLLHGKEGFSS
jgi:hypothetical protein